MDLQEYIHIKKNLFILRTNITNTLKELQWETTSIYLQVDGCGFILLHFIIEFVYIIYLNNVI